MVADAAARFGAALPAPSGSTVEPGPEPRGPGPGRPLRRAARRRAHRPHRRRPGRDRAAEPAAGRRASTGLAGMRRGPAPPAARPAPGRDRGAVRGRGARRRWTTRPTPTRPSGATGSATRCCPLLDDVAGRDVVPVLARQAELLGEETELPGPRWPPPSTPPTPGPLQAAAPALARRALRAWLLAGRWGPTTRSTPPRSTGCWRWSGTTAAAADVQAGWRVAAHRRAPDAWSAAATDCRRGERPPRRGDDDGSVVRVDDPHLGRIVVPADAAGGPDRRARRADHRGLPGPSAAAGRGAEGRVHVHGRPRPAHIALPVEFDFMAVSSYGAPPRPAASSAS